jgi:hypothetical protein
LRTSIIFVVDVSYLTPSINARIIVSEAYHRTDDDDTPFPSLVDLSAPHFRQS